LLWVSLFLLYDIFLDSLFNILNDKRKDRNNNITKIIFVYKRGGIDIKLLNVRND